MDLAQELLKLGPPGLICVFLWLALYKSEQREHKKDSRIQMLENLLTESYDERIAAADRVADAIHGTRAALESLTAELRANKR
jgi:hypothetical protein